MIVKYTGFGAAEIEDLARAESLKSQG